MLGQAVLLALFLLLRGHQGQDSPKDVVGLSGKPVCLRPSNISVQWTSAISVQWKKTQQGSHAKPSVILDWRPPNHKKQSMDSSDLNNIYDFDVRDFALCIKSAKLQDSGHYVLEITDSNGKVCTKEFRILIFDHVEKPHLQGQWKIWANGTCQLSLYCLVPKDDNVSYALYRGSTLISKQRNDTHWESQIDRSSLHTYTCNVSNKVSSASHTLNFTQGCQRVFSKFRILPFVVTIVILATLFLSAIICFCIWDKKRKQSQFAPREFLTIYEYIKDPQVKKDELGHSRASGSSSVLQQDEKGQRELDRGLFKEQISDQRSPADGNTIYSMIQFKPSDSTPQENSILYSVIQSSRKSRSKKRNQKPSLNCSVYEEVGKQCLKSHNPARLSHRELENFDVYS